MAIFTHLWSHDVRLTGFRRLTVVNGTPGIWGVTFLVVESLNIYPFINNVHGHKFCVALKPEGPLTNR